MGITHTAPKLFTLFSQTGGLFQLKVTQYLSTQCSKGLMLLHFFLS